MDPFSTAVFAPVVAVVVPVVWVSVPTDEVDMGEAGPLPYIISSAPERTMADSPPAPSPSPSVTTTPPQPPTPVLSVSAPPTPPQTEVVVTPVNNTNKPQPVAYKTTPPPSIIITTTSVPPQPTLKRPSVHKVETTGDKMCRSTITTMIQNAEKRLKDQQDAAEHKAKEARNLAQEQAARDERARKGESEEGDEGLTVLATFDFDAVLLKQRTESAEDDLGRLLERFGKEEES